MQKPPFQLATSLAGGSATGCCDHEDTAGDRAGAGRPQARSRLGTRLAELDPHLHCSVIGTCLSTAELRKLMARFLFVRDSSDLELHHEAVSHSSQGGPITKALHKLLDQRHDAVVHRFMQARDATELGELWTLALRQGEVPGAYWALLTHRHVTPELRQRAFGDVHMRSHLVGSANRADIRRLVALERENDEWRDRAERQQLRAQELAEERERMIDTLERQLANARSARDSSVAPSGTVPASDEVAAVLSQVALQTGRRERAEQSACVAAGEAARLQGELDHLTAHARTLGRELLAAETQLREIEGGAAAPDRALAAQLHGRRVFYVGGRPSSTPAWRGRGWSSFRSIASTTIRRAT